MHSFVRFARAASKAARQLSRTTLISSQLGPARSRDQDATRRLLSYVRDSRGYEHFQSNSGRTLDFRRYGLVLGGTALFVGVQYYRSIEEVPYTQRRHAVFVAPQQEITLGRQIYQQIKDEAREQGHLLPDHSAPARLVRKVGERIAEVAVDGHGGGNYGHLQNVEWEFTVIDSPEANAFVAPGGKVVVYSGLLRLLRTEDELAAVLAHEAAHVLARHQGERMSQMSIFTIIKIVVWLTLGINIPTALAAVSIFLPHSRTTETEADVIGLRLMARACYNPDAAITMLQKLHGMEAKMEKEAGMRIPAMLRTHPLSEARVTAVKKDLPEAMRLLEASNCTSGSLNNICGLLISPDLRQTTHISVNDKKLLATSKPQKVSIEAANRPRRPSAGSAWSPPPPFFLVALC